MDPRSEPSVQRIPVATADPVQSHSFSFFYGYCGGRLPMECNAGPPFKANPKIIDIYPAPDQIALYPGMCTVKHFCFLGNLLATDSRYRCPHPGTISVCVLTGVPVLFLATG